MRIITVKPDGPASQYGRCYVAVLDDGLVLATHYSSNENFAKGDLGFLSPEECHPDSRSNSENRRKTYAEACNFEPFEVKFSHE